MENEPQRVSSSLGQLVVERVEVLQLGGGLALADDNLISIEHLDRQRPTVDAVVTQVEDDEEEPHVVRRLDLVAVDPLKIVDDQRDFVVASLTDEFLLWHLRVVLEIVVVRQSLEVVGLGGEGEEMEERQDE